MDGQWTRKVTNCKINFNLIVGSLPFTNLKTFYLIVLKEDGENIKFVEFKKCYSKFFFVLINITYYSYLTLILDCQICQVLLLIVVLSAIVWLKPKLFD